MNILTRWGFRMLRADRTRTITTIFAVVGFFALVTGSLFVSNGLERAAEAAGNGLFLLMTTIVCVCAFGIAAFTLVSVFSATVDEYRRESRILYAAGATGQQIFRSLMLRALALDLFGAAVGIPAGIAASRLILTDDAFRTELLWFFWLRNTQLILAGCLLVAPGAMLAAALLARLPRRRTARAAKRWLFRSTPTRRIFGVGGALGRLSSRKYFRYRTIFTLTFAVCFIATAILTGTTRVLSQAQTTDTDVDVAIECWYYPADTSAQQKIDELLQTCLADGLVDAYSTERRPIQQYSTLSYCVLDEEWLTDEARQRAQQYWSESDPKFDYMEFYYYSEPFQRDEKTQFLLSGCGVLFLDDASFLRYAQENGIDADTDDILLFHPGKLGETTQPLLQNTDTGWDVTLRFLPWSFTENQTQQEDETFDPVDWMRTADAQSVSETVHLAGAVTANPSRDGYYSHLLWSPTWIVPEHLADRFAVLPSLYPSDFSSRTETRVHTTQPQTVCDLFADAFRDDPKCRYVQTRFGVGSNILNTVDFSFSAAYEDAQATAYLRIENLYEDQADIAALLRFLPLLERFLLLFTAVMLFAAILNTAHMNRMSRRREKAILDSIGMDPRQRNGMLLYESARYALRSAVYGCLFFTLCYWIWYREVPMYLLTERLDVNPDVPYYAYGVRLSANYLLRAFPAILAHVWWIFVGGAALVFVLLVLCDKWIDRVYRREELIQILKDDFG